MKSPPPVVRLATAQDLLGLMALRPDEPTHRERIARQDEGNWAYLVAADSASGAQSQTIYGFALLIWEGDEYHNGHPVLADIFVRTSLRGQGFGTRLIERAEWLCRERGLPRLGLSVNPTENPRALALYQRLDYRPTPAEPYCVLLTLTDEHGVFRIHEDWRISLVKKLMQEN